ncbi:hypothetical protein SOVF_089940, partial [Spinacia oleracea]
FCVQLGHGAPHSHRVIALLRLHRRALPPPSPPASTPLSGYVPPPHKYPLNPP